MSFMDGGVRHGARGRFERTVVAQPCPYPTHRGSTVFADGLRYRKDGTPVRRFECIPLAGDKHKFSVAETDDAPPKFAPVKCVEHPGSRVIRSGVNNKDGTRYQRYECRPADGAAKHRFVLPLPRVHVADDTSWKTSDAAKNPHRGPTAAGRGMTATTDIAAEGLQMLSLGRSYTDVGVWAAAQRPKRHKDKELEEERAARRKSAAPPKRNKWQTGAAWVEQFSPVLWAAWQQRLASTPGHSTLPRVLMIDDSPFDGRERLSDRGHATELFAVLVAVEYFQASETSTVYDHRVRLIRAYPNRGADAYELLVAESGVLPDVIVSDSGAAIQVLIGRLRKLRPGLVWIPSEWHVQRALQGMLATLTSPKRLVPFSAGDLATRLDNKTLFSSPAAWTDWWDDLYRRLDVQRVPKSHWPTRQRRDYFQPVADALTYLDTRPAVPRGTGGLEAQIHAKVKPFFAPRAHRFANLERINRAADLLTLRLNGQMDDKAAIAELLRNDASTADGYVPPARAINDNIGYKSLRDDDLLHAALVQAREEMKARWLA